MALSDSCLDILEELSIEIANYSNFSYELDCYVPLIDAVFNLAAFIADQIRPTESYDNDLDMIISYLVVGNLLGKSVEENMHTGSTIQDFLSLIAKLSKIHTKLAHSLDSVHNGINSGGSQVFQKQNPNTINYLKEIIKLQKTM
jgi:hypothetical protein